MEITFDPAKDAANLAKHGLSLEWASDLDWETAVIKRDDRRNYGEVRYVAVGYIGDRLYFTAYVERDGGHRIISLRKANPREIRTYAQT